MNNNKYNGLTQYLVIGMIIGLFVGVVFSIIMRNNTFSQ
ncbi:membrane protein [Clostridium botulinum A1 str. CFSAN002368]|nr:membrane protein [Clostridium botulinum A1 str. CFSAN002368]